MACPLVGATIIWTNAGTLPSRTLATDLSEILKEILIFFIQENASEDVICKMMSISSPSVS